MVLLPRQSPSHAIPKDAWQPPSVLTPPSGRAPLMPLVTTLVAPLVPELPPPLLDGLTVLLAPLPWEVPPPVLLLPPAWPLEDDDDDDDAPC